MNRVRGRAITIVAGICLTAMLAVVPSAQAAVTSSSITTPKNNIYFLYNHDTLSTFAISGTTNGTTGDHVDVNCYDGDKTTTVVSNVAVNANGSFSVSAAPAQYANTFRLCQLRAVPHATSPDPLTPYAGPRLLVGQTETYHVSGGANDGKLYDYYLYFQQPQVGNDYDSVGGCGIDDGYLLDNSNSLSTVTWWCNGWLNKTDQATAPTRSGIQIDGVNAYPPAEAYYVNSDATAGFPKLSRSYSQDSKTGNSVIHETDPFVKCTTQTYPPTTVTCPSFASTGITDTRTIVQDHGGRVAWITDVFKNTTGKARKLDLLWQNDQHFYETGGTASQVEYEFPGQSDYATHAVGDLVTLPKKAGKILVRYHGSVDGDPSHGLGAIVYDHLATVAKFMNLTSSQSDFTLHQVVTVPAHGTARLRFAYIADFQQVKVDALAKQAATVFKGCKVPKVVGKRLTAAKKAIRRAHCAVGKIGHAASSTIPAGVVIATNPTAGTQVDYGAKVALLVSSG